MRGLPSGIWGWKAGPPPAATSRSAGTPRSRSRPRRTRAAGRTSAPKRSRGSDQGPGPPSPGADVAPASAADVPGDDALEAGRVARPLRKEQPGNVLEGPGPADDLIDLEERGLALVEDALVVDRQHAVRRGDHQLSGVLELVDGVAGLDVGDRERGRAAEQAAVDAARGADPEGAGAAVDEEAGHDRRAEDLALGAQEVPRADPGTTPMAIAQTATAVTG